MPFGASTPWSFFIGLKWSPALLNGASHLPTWWKWIACSPAGSPLRSPFIRTPALPPSKVIVPSFFPEASDTSAVAVVGAAAGFADLDDWANAGTVQSTTRAAKSRMTTS